MAANAEEMRIVTVPVDMRTEDPINRGEIKYIYISPSDPIGLFSFSWYFRHEPTIANRNVQINTRGDRLKAYLLGLMTYVQCTEQPEFEGWKVVIYTDETTIQSLNSIVDDYPVHYATARAILTHPNVIVAKCSWPEYYTGYNGANAIAQSKKIDGIILRLFRNRAFCDFHTIPVFVRDADTIFTILESGNVYDKIQPQPKIVKKVKEWEHTLYTNFTTSGKQFLVTSNILYRKPWHFNQKTKLYTMGFLAGLTASLGGLEEWNPTNPENLWLKSIDFVRERTPVTHSPPLKQLSNVLEYTYVGKDEQVIPFVWLPEIADRTFFFYESVLFHNYIRDYTITKWNNPPENNAQQNGMYLDSLKGFLKEIADSLPERSVTKNTISRSPGSAYFSIRPSATTPPPGGEDAQLKLEQGIIHERMNELKKRGDIRPNFNFTANLLPYIQKNSTMLTSDSTYFINEAFRDPLYDTVLRTIWKRLNRAYQAKKAAAGGRRQTRKRKARRSKHTRRR